MHQQARLRRRPAFLAPEVWTNAIVRPRPIVDVVIIPVSDTAGVVDIALEPDVDAEFEQYLDEGSQCAPGCGFCGRCS